MLRSFPLSRGRRDRRLFRLHAALLEDQVAVDRDLRSRGLLALGGIRGLAAARTVVIVAGEHGAPLHAEIALGKARAADRTELDHRYPPIAPPGPPGGTPAIPGPEPRFPPTSSAPRRPSGSPRACRPAPPACGYRPASGTRPHRT